MIRQLPSIKKAIIENNLGTLIELVNKGTHIESITNRILNSRNLHLLNDFLNNVHIKDYRIILKILDIGLKNVKTHSELQEQVPFLSQYLNQNIFKNRNIVNQSRLFFWWSRQNRELTLDQYLYLYDNAQTPLSKNKVIVYLAEHNTQLLGHPKFKYFLDKLSFRDGKHYTYLIAPEWSNILHHLVVHKKSQNLNFLVSYFGSDVKRYLFYSLFALHDKYRKVQTVLNMNDHDFFYALKVYVSDNMANFVLNVSFDSQKYKVFESLYNTKKEQQENFFLFFNNSLDEQNLTPIQISFDV